MKNLLLIACLVTGFQAFAGSMPYTPIQLIGLENEGREVFLKNALAQARLTMDPGVNYQQLQGTIIGGDENGADFKGALFGFNVILIASDRQKFACEQRLSVGNFDQRYTTEITCTKM